jgi:hypothetical protein
LITRSRWSGADDARHVYTLTGSPFVQLETRSTVAKRDRITDDARHVRVHSLVYLLVQPLTDGTARRQTGLHAAQAQRNTSMDLSGVLNERKQADTSRDARARSLSPPFRSRRRRRGTVTRMVPNLSESRHVDAPRSPLKTPPATARLRNSNLVQFDATMSADWPNERQ